jgi:SAM-dependent methyltransferase
MSVIQREKDYVHSLSHFLRSSGEIKIVDSLVNQTIERFPNWWKSLIKKRQVRILDVGAGDGSKSIYFANLLSQRGISVKIDSIEPTALYRKMLIKNYKKIHNRFCGKIWDCPLHEVKSMKKYDVVFLIHSVYQLPTEKDGTLLTLEQLCNFISPNGMAIIVVGHPTSDLHYIKKIFFPIFKKDSPVSSETVKETFQKNNVSLDEGKIIELKVNLGKSVTSLEKRGRQFAFLFYDSLCDNPLKPNQYSQVGQWIEKNTRDKGKRYLLVRDALFWIRGKAI